MSNPKQDECDLIEKLAAIEHERWADWQQWVFDCCTNGDNGDLVIPKKFVKKWGVLVYKPYILLSEHSKQANRDQVARYWSLIQAAQERTVAEAQHIHSFSFLYNPSERCKYCGLTYIELKAQTAPQNRGEG